MRRKYYSKTYLKDIRKYKIQFDFSNDDYITCIKEIIDGDDFSPHGDVKLISNGYYIVEIVPKEGNYVMRAYLDNNKEIQGYYFDIVSDKGIDELTRIPFYDDLYLDVGVNKDGKAELLDKDELDEAHNLGNIDDNTYQMAIVSAEELMEEIRQGKNKYMNLLVSKLQEGEIEIL